MRVILIVAFAGLLGAAGFLGRRSGSRAEGAASAAAARSRYGFSLQEVSHSAGVDAVHQAPKLHALLDPIMPEVASMGAAVSVVDFDRDGKDDLYVVNSGEGSKNHLYRNLGDNHFEDVAERVGLADVNRPGSGVSMGAIWGDYDNDGYQDLLLNKWGRPALFHNDGGKKFTLVDNAGLPEWVNANSAVWFDYDRDGRLDLFIGGYYPENLNLWDLKTTRIMPESFEYAQNGGRKYLLRNLGGGRFEDVTEKVGLNSRRWALAAAAADLRGTGYPDLVIANDYGVTEFWANDGGKRFREIGKQVGIAVSPKSGMNVCFGDINNTGRFAIYVSNITEEGILIQGNNLWVPREGTAGDRLTYDNWANSLGVEEGGWSFGAQFGDLNNDGFQDLFLTNGYVSGDPKSSYWYDFTKVALGNSAVIQDARNWPAIGNRSHAGYQKKCVWLNEARGSQERHFTEVAQAVGVTETFDGRSVAMADFGNNGALDVAVAHQKQPLLLYRNDVTPENAWIEFELEGTRSNRSAIGAEVRVFWDGMQQLQQVSGASGFCAQNGRRLHFGLGKAPHIEKVTVRWPSGAQQTLTDVEPGKLHHVKEPA